MKVKILGKTYTVVLVSSSELPNDHGECNNEKQLIKVRDDIHQEQQADTTLHEVFHAIDSSVGAKMSENQIRRMATGMLSVLYDNPDFVEYLCQKKSITSLPKKKSRSSPK